MSANQQQTTKDSLNLVNNEKLQENETNRDMNTNFVNPCKDTIIKIHSVHKESGIHFFNNVEAKGNETCSENRKKFHCSLSNPLRKIMFLICNIIGLGLWIFVMQLLPTPGYPRGFITYYSLASVLFVLSLLFLYGPIGYLKRAFTLQSVLITLTYIATSSGAVLSAIWLDSTLFTVVFAMGHIASFVCFVVVNAPGGPAWCRNWYSNIAAKVDEYMRIN